MKHKITSIEVELTGPGAPAVTFWREDDEGRQYRYTPVNLLRLIGVVNDNMILDKGLVFATDIGWEYHPHTNQ